MPVESDPSAVLAAGERALRDGAWEEARARFEEALREGDSAAGWDGRSRTAWWLGETDVALAGRERAYRAHRAAGEDCAAARQAAWLALDHWEVRGSDAVAQAWLSRARELAERGCPCADSSWVTLIDAELALVLRGDLDAACAQAERAVALGREHGVREIEVIGAAVLGSALIAAGDVRAGVRRLEEACTLGAGEACDPVAPGWALCHTVTWCALIGDFARAHQWCRTLRAFAEQWSSLAFSGSCRTAYGSVLTTAGEWGEAERELGAAIAEFSAARPALAAPSAVRLGELRARQGRTDEARTLFERARPHPLAFVGLGRLQLDAGDERSAADAAQRVLRRIPPGNRLDRLPALELLALAHAAEAEGDGASAALEELREHATAIGTDYVRGRLALVEAAVAAAAGAHDAARLAAEDAADLFGGSDAPYDVATARLELAAALAALGRRSAAAVEARAALEAFRALGAARDVERAAALLAGATGERTRSDELSPRELEVLRLVAAGLSDAQIAERLVLSPHTVHRHVANVRAKLRLPSRAAAVSWATRNGLL